MHLVNKRQDSSSFETLPPLVAPPLTGITSDPLGDGSSYTTTVTSFILSTQLGSNGRPLNTWTLEAVATSTQTLLGPPPLATAGPSSGTVATLSFDSPLAPAETTVPTQTPSSSSKAIPLSTLIPAIVVPIVVVALVAPIILYFCLTRHDRQRSKSRMSSRVTSHAYPDSRQEVKSPTSRVYSSETQNSKASHEHNLKSSEIMNFDLTPAVEKPLPVVSVMRATGNAGDRPRRPDRPDQSETWEVRGGLQTSIGQAVSRYSIDLDSASNRGPDNRTSAQGLTEENMRIARLANDSKASFGGREPDAVSEISAPEPTPTRQISRRGLDELSDVSSLYEDDRPPSQMPGGEILGNSEARRSGPLS